MNSLSEFNSYVKDIEVRNDYHRPVAFGLGIRKKKGDFTLEVFYPHINFTSSFGTAAVLLDILGYKGQENGFSVISSDQVNLAFNKLKVFENDIQNHPNLKLLKQFSNAHPNS